MGSWFPSPAGDSRVAQTAPTRRIVPVLIVTLVVAALARFQGLATDSLWGDDLFSLEMATLSFGSAIRTMAEDIVHPPLYYLLLRPVVWLLGDAPVTLRLLSFVAGCLLPLAGVLATWSVTQSRLFSLVSGMILALSEQAIFQSLNVRSYSLYALAVLACAVLMFRAVMHPGDTRRGIAWAAAAIGGTLILHYVSLLYLVFLTLLFWRMSPRMQPIRFAAMFAPGFLLLAAWAGMVLPSLMRVGGLERNLGWVATPSFSDFLVVTAGLLGAPPVADGTRGTLLWYALLALVLWTIAWRHRRRGFAAPGTQVAVPPTLEGMLWVALAVPAITYAIAVSPLQVGMFGDRHLVPTVGLFAVGASVGAHRQLVGIHPALRMAVAAGLLMPSLLAAWKGPAHTRIPYDQVAAALHAKATGPALTTNPYEIGRPVNYYLTRNGAAVRVTSVEAHDLRRAERVRILYRPGVSTAPTLVDSLVRSGWRKALLGHWGGPDLGTSMVELTR